MTIKETDEVIKLNFLEKRAMKSVIKKSKKFLKTVSEKEELQYNEKVKKQLIKGLVDMSEILEIYCDKTNKVLLEPDFQLMDVHALVKIYEESVKVLEKMLGK